MLSLKAPKMANKPAKNVIETEMKSGGKTTVNKVRSLVGHGRYRKDLKKAALRRAAAILRSQRPLPANRKGAKKAAPSKKTD
jgi:large subunit ribosomal protein L28e